MDIDDYQKQAMKSVAIKEKSIAALAHRSLGLAGEAGITANMIKKIIRDQHGVLSNQDIIDLTEKIGDVLYYVAVLADYCQVSLSEVADKNLEKSAAFLENRNKK